jgi:hypothetical protein
MSRQLRLAIRILPLLVMARTPLELMEAACLEITQPWFYFHYFSRFTGILPIFLYSYSA